MGHSIRGKAVQDLSGKEVETSQKSWVSHIVSLHRLSVSDHIAPDHIGVQQVDALRRVCTMRLGLRKVKVVVMLGRADLCWFQAINPLGVGLTPSLLDSPRSPRWLRPCDHIPYRTSSVDFGILKLHVKDRSPFALLPRHPFLPRLGYVHLFNPRPCGSVV